MKRFRSSLQALQVVRERQEQTAMERYAETLRARQAATEALARVDDELSRASASLRARLTRGTSADELQREHGHYRVLESKRQAAVRDRDAAERAVLPALQEMLRARRQREIVEQCIDRQRMRHDREEVRKENRMLDELAGRRLVAIGVGVESA